jgi:hypothetical protein
MAGIAAALLKRIAPHDVFDQHAPLGSVDLQVVFVYFVALWYCYTDSAAKRSASPGARVRPVGRRSFVADMPETGDTHALTTHSTVRP